MLNLKIRSYSIVLFLFALVPCLTSCGLYGDDPTEPDSPASFTATASDLGKITVNWTPPANDGSSPIIGYTIKATGPGGYEVERTHAAESLPYIETYTGLVALEQYFFSITAVNAMGESEEMNADAYAAVIEELYRGTAYTGSIVFDGDTFSGTFTADATSISLNDGDFNISGLYTRDSHDSGYWSYLFKGAAKIGAVIYNSHGSLHHHIRLGKYAVDHGLALPGISTSDMTNDYAGEISY